MNFLNHRQKARCRVLPMPQDLQELMGDISREVLRCQPSIDCTYKFIADYLDAMIKTSEKAQIAMEIINLAILKTDEVYDQFAKCNIPKDKTDSFLNLMETTFRRFIEKKRRLKEDPRYITFRADDLFDELMRKCDLTRVEVLRSRPAIQWAYKKFVKTYLAAVEGILDTEGLYVETDAQVYANKELRELNESAILIQKNYRGYYTRKALNESRNKKPSPEASYNTFKSDANEIGSFLLFAEENKAKMDKAAVKIQASYKGLNERQKMRRGTGYVTPVEDSDDRQIENKIDMFYEPTSDELEELNKSAILIQKSYRGHYARREMHEKHARVPEPCPAPSQQTIPKIDSFLDYAEEHQAEMDKAAVKIQASYKGFRTRKEMLEAKGIPHDTADEGQVENDLDTAHEPNLGDPEKQVENNLDIVQEQTSEDVHEEPSKATVELSKEIPKIDSFLDYAAEHQAEMDKAAVKIQASYKGYRTRKKMIGAKGIGVSVLNIVVDGEHQDEGNIEMIDESIVEDLEELNKAATTIQANFKGYKVRKDMHQPHDKAE